MKNYKLQFNYAVREICRIPSQWLKVIRDPKEPPLQRIGMLLCIPFMPLAMLLFLFAIWAWEPAPSKFNGAPIKAYILDMFNRCHWCIWRKATWFYGPGYYSACDNCVPRGCSCNQEPVDGDFDNHDPDNWNEPLDDKGRRRPCCEWL